MDLIAFFVTPGKREERVLPSTDRQGEKKEKKTKSLLSAVASDSGKKKKEGPLTAPP